MMRTGNDARYPSAFKAPRAERPHPVMQDHATQMIQRPANLMVVGRFGKELEGGWIVEVDMVKVFNCRKI
jgi:hypothetical protein